MGVFYGRFEKIRERVRQWLRMKEDGETTQQWIPLDIKDLQELGEYQKLLQQNTKREVVKITIEMETKNIETGEIEKGVVLINNPLLWEMTQHVNWPEYGAKSDSYTFHCLAVCRRSR